ncbi:MAG: hypothetical protein LBS11_04730 [Oscillospiraceae bacterium]|jgi:hypothetical protein|nr:hypothetical protein [Oscillospiraceae bacterium]
MTRDQAVAALCVWARINDIIGVVSGRIEEYTGRALAIRGATVHARPAVAAVRERRFGDGIGYAAGMAEWYERRAGYMREVARSAAGLARMVDECVGADEGTRRALRERGRGRGNWTAVGAVCGVNPEAARRAYVAALRMLVKRAWTEKEDRVVGFALRYVWGGSMPRELRPAARVASAG